MIRTSVGLAAAVLHLASAAGAQQLPQQALAVRIGLDSGTLAASGASAQDVQSALAALAEATEEAASLAAPAGSVDSTSAAVGAVLADPDASAEAIAAVQAQCAAARATADAAAGALRAEALAAFPPAVAARIEHCLAASGVDAPVAFKTVPRSPGGWDAIRAALRAEQRSLRLGEDVPSEAAALLGSVRAEQSVADATVLVAANLSMFESLLVGSGD